MSEKHPAEIECPVCAGDGCQNCQDGWFEVRQCPSKYIGQELIEDIRVISASEHHLPCSGGLLDQSAWWFELRQILKGEESRIQEEQMKRKQS